MKRIEQLCPSLLSYSPPIWAASLVGVLVISTLFLSMLLLFQHLSSYKNPEEQKFLIGVILMVPFYAIESLSDIFVRSFGLSGQVDYISFSIPRLYQNYHNYTAIFYMYVSLVDPSISIDCAILRDCYEAFAMYCFGRYLVACLGGEEKTIEFLNRQGTLSSTAPLLGNAAEKGVMKHPFPMNYFLKPWRLGEWFYQIIKMGIVQYMIIKTVTAILAVFLEAFGVYCDGEFTWTCGYPYMAVVINFSQSWALYCLVQFYAATKDELAHIKPLAKFLMFKSIVFLTWWQDVAIALLYSWGLFKSPIAQGLQFNSSVQDFIICIEMCGASVVHLFVFPAKPYKLMGDNFLGGVSVLGDYASLDCPLDPNEVKDSERPTKLRLPQPDVAKKGKTPIRESVRDVVLGGGEYIVNDLKFTMTHAVEPMEKGLTKFNKKLQKISQHIRKHDGKFRTKDDSCIGSSSPSRRVVRGIDDPLLNPSFSDSGAKSSGKYRRKSGYASAESGGDGSDPPHGRFEIHGCRWITKD